jgi:acyl carrier protein
MKNVEKVVISHLNFIVNNGRKRHIRDEASLKEDLALDSMKQVSLFTGIIQQLCIDIGSFDDNELFHIKTVGDLKRVLFSKVKPPGHSVN